LCAFIYLMRVADSVVLLEIPLPQLVESIIFTYTCHQNLYKLSWYFSLNFPHRLAAIAVLSLHLEAFLLISSFFSSIHNLLYTPVLCLLSPGSLCNPSRILHNPSPYPSISLVCLTMLVPRPPNDAYMKDLGEVCSDLKLVAFFQKLAPWDVSPEVGWHRKADENMKMKPLAWLVWVAIDFPRPSIATN